MNVKKHIRSNKLQREAEGYLELGLPQQALQTLARLGDPAGYTIEALYLWGEGLRALERPFEALVPLERAIKSAPEDVRIRLALGWCYKRTGRIDLAIDTLKQAIHFDPEESLLRYNLACYLSLSGQKRLALRYLAEAVSMNSVYHSLIEDESDFDPIRNDPDFQASFGKKGQSPSVKQPLDGQNE